MKKLLFILIALPMIGFGQTSWSNIDDAESFISLNILKNRLVNNEISFFYSMGFNYNDLLLTEKIEFFQSPSDKIDYHYKLPKKEIASFDFEFIENSNWVLITFYMRNNSNLITRYNFNGGKLVNKKNVSSFSLVLSKEILAIEIEFKEAINYLISTYGSEPLID